LINLQREESMSKEKPFKISKKAVWEAYRRVKANRGAAGVDEQWMEEFEKKLKDNLYKIWNRMSSGSYFPPAVKVVEIPKKRGGQRVLGIPTVSDRIAQAVVKIYLEPELEPLFHADSYGYRPGKSAIEAVGKARERCWRYNWVLDLDIKGFFDSMGHELLMRAVRKHTNRPWIVLYVERWLKAPAQAPDGRLEQRGKGTPQGGVISPLLANLFLHDAFDDWMRRNHPEIPFERYADDMIVHCETEQKAKQMKKAIEERLKQCKLELNGEKTRVIYCKDDNRKGSHEQQGFDFLGFAFRPRPSRNRWGKYFVNFSPAISRESAKSIREAVKAWRLPQGTSQTLTDIAERYNPVIRGWINYYGSYYGSSLYRVLYCITRSLRKWAMKKYKKFHRRPKRAGAWLRRIAQRDRMLFAHWHLSERTTAGQ
jgi:RNA-directed DNA polymerase